MCSSDAPTFLPDLESTMPYKVTLWCCTQLYEILSWKDRRQQGRSVAGNFIAGLFCFDSDSPETFDAVINGTINNLLL